MPDKDTTGMRIGIAVKFLLFLLIAFALTTIGSVYFMNRIIVKNYIEYREGDLSALSRALDESISSISNQSFDPVFTRNLDLLASQTEGRITISDPSGRVFYDSKHVREDKFLDKETEMRISPEAPLSSFYIRMPEDLSTVYFPAKQILSYMSRIEDVSLVYFAPLKRQSEIIGQVMIDERATPMRSSLTSVRDNLIIFMAGMYLVFALVAFIAIQRGLIGPVAQIVEICKKASDGELEDRVAVKSNDEISSLARNFNTLLYNIKKNHTELEERNEGLIHFASELESRNEEIMRKQKLIEFDLRLAHNVQQELLPQAYPKIDGIEISAANFQVGEIGGDCFDFYKLDDGTLGAFIGDVSGKGIAAALVMSMVTILFSQLKEDMDNPAKILGKVNDIMYRHFGSRHSIYLTCFFLAMDPKKMEIHFSCAGHNPPFLYRPSTDEMIALESEGFGLGMFSKVIYEGKIQKVQPGDKIVLFTDGVVDSRNAEGKMFGLDNLKETIRQNADSNSFRLTHVVVEELEDFAEGAKRQDDLTVIVITVKEPKG